MLISINLIPIYQLWNLRFAKTSLGNFLYQEIPLEFSTLRFVNSGNDVMFLLNEVLCEKMAILFFVIPRIFIKKF